MCTVGAAHPIHVFQCARYQLPNYRQWLYKQREHCLRTFVLVGFLFSLLRGYLPMLLSLFLPIETVRNNISLFMTLVSFIAVTVFFIWQDLHMPMKKPLVLTMRTKRLFSVLIGLYILASLILRIFSIPAYLVYAVVPFAVWLAGRIMDPIEERINAGFYHEARRKLLSRKDLIKIAITGSYGKTLTKFILAGILSEKYDVLATPASFNTAMGISRVVNDSLEDHHQVFIAEMGGQHIGDIRYLTRLVGPKIGIITSIGPQHLDTYGSMANIAEGKYELIQGLPEDGIAFFASDSGYTDRLYGMCTKEKYNAAVDPMGDCTMTVTELTMNPDGMSFWLTHASGERVRCATRLLGRYNAQNIALSGAVAYTLGMTMSEIANGISHLQPFEKKLQLIPGDKTIIDDTQNESPLGAAEALSVLAEFPGRRIMITPGLPASDDKEEEINYAFGTQMKDCVDNVILIGDKKKLKPLVRGMAAAGIPKAMIRVAADADDAEDILDEISETGDTVLYECSAQI